MKVKRTELLEALRAVEPGLSSKEVIEQAQCFVFTGGDILTYNDEIAMRVSSPVEIEGAVVAAPLLRLLERMDDEEVTLDVTGGELRLKGKRKKGGVKMEEEVSMPVESIEKPEKFKKLPDTFRASLSTVVGTCGRDESKFMLTCVHITKEFTEACDNFQLTRYPQALRLKKDVCVPAASVRALLRYDVTHYSFAADWAHFKNKEGVVFSCRSYLEEYPDLGGMFEFESNAVKLPEGLKNAVDRAEIFSGGEMTENRVQVTLKSTQLRLRGEGDMGWYEETHRVTFEGEDLTFSMDPVLLKDVLSRTNVCEVGEGRMSVTTDSYSHVACLQVAENA